ncbi:MAG: glycoside hydrolase family 2 TIM barrel-domain containing protein [Breznakia sp.]
MKKNEANLAWLSDPEIFQINRKEPCSDHKYYDSLVNAKQKSAMKWKQSLNGEWYFSYAKNAQDRISDFYKLDYDCHHFDRIEVPSHIQLKGYDQIHYINTLYPWDGKEQLRPPHISNRYNPVASYVNYFKLDDNLKNQAGIDLVFEGVECAFYVWLNGIFIGYSEDSFTHSTFDISDALQDGVNKLAIEVYKYSSASWLEDQDFFRFSGIFRNVDVYAKPKVHVEDIFVYTKLKHKYKSADIQVDLKTSQECAKMDICVYHPSGEKVYEKKQCPFASFTFSLDNVALWSAEKPNRYELYLQVYDDGGALIEVVPQFFGIREFKMDNNIMKLNGQRIIFKGINRHEFSAERGRSLTKEDMLFDIKFLKQHNINAVRTSHYPNQSLWYELCDEYGIYLMDEANLESHGSWQKLGECEPSWNVPGNLAQWEKAVLDRAANMLQRDKNHPSILIWSCGNESYAGVNIVAMANYFRKQDPTRLVHYEGCVWNRAYEAATDMESRMYAKVKEIKTYLDNNPKKPYISCEYMHAMGNSLGGMSHYTDLEDAYEMYQGGFIWDYIDQAISYKNDDGEKVLGYGGDFKDRYTDYNFSGNGILFADRSISPKVQEVKYCYQDIKIKVNEQGVMIDNQMLFTNAEQFTFVYFAKSNGKILQEGKLLVSLEPLQSKQFAIDWIDAHEEIVYSVHALLKEDTKWESKDYEVAFSQMVKGRYEEVNVVGEPLQISKGDGNIGVACEHFKALFANKEGLISLVYDGIEYIVRAPRPTFSRASTDNDRGCNHEFHSSLWYAASSFFSCRLFTYEICEKSNQVIIRYEYVLPTTPQTSFDVQYTITSPGIIHVDCCYHGQSGLPDLPLVGMCFKLYNRVDRFTYFGKGPLENYEDRKQGAKLDVYEETVKHNVTPYLVPQECGNRCDVRYVNVVDKNHNGVSFVSKTAPFSMKVLPYSMQELENAMHQEELTKSYYTYVTIMAKQMGVGGDDSWGSFVLDEYQIPSDQDIQFSFDIKQAKGGI